MKTQLTILLILLKIFAICSNPITEITNCKQTISTEAFKLKDKTLIDIIPRSKVFLKIDVNTVSLFEQSKNIESIIDAENFINFKYPLRFVKGDPRCLIISKRLNNHFTICLKNKDDELIVYNSINFIARECLNILKSQKKEMTKFKITECYYKQRLNYLKNKKFLKNKQ
jgi:hypothetical protein